MEAATLINWLYPFGIFFPGEDGYVVAEAPSLPGCVSQGKTRDEEMAHVREAIFLHEDVLRERGARVPK